MRWKTDRRPRYTKGGYWQCVHKLHETQRRYDRTDAGRTRSRRYQLSPKGRETQRRYRESPVGALAKQLLELARVRVRY